MKKSEIETRKGRPCINVKCYNFARGLDISAEFGCDQRTADHAGEYAWQTACEEFWRQMPVYAAEIFPGCEVYSEGRSSGWLVVHGLPPVESWDAVMLSKWSKLCKLAASEMEYLTSAENVKAEIIVNEWVKPGAELYNFVDTAAGPRCLADLKREAREAGFGPVIRS